MKEEEGGKHVKPAAPIYLRIKEIISTERFLWRGFRKEDLNSALNVMHLPGFSGRNAFKPPNSKELVLGLARV